MYVPEKLKINKLRVVSIPRAKTIMDRLQGRVPTPAAYSGDESMPMAQNKLDGLREAEHSVMEEYDKMLQKEASDSQ